MNYQQAIEAIKEEIEDFLADESGVIATLDAIVSILEETQSE